MVEQDSPFLIATHSPILMAIAAAAIFSFDRAPVREVACDDTEHVSLFKAFLKDPGRFLRRI
jgi:predicted ATPase